MILLIKSSSLLFLGLSPLLLPLGAVYDTVCVNRERGVSNVQLQ